MLLLGIILSSLFYTNVPVAPMYEKSTNEKQGIVSQSYYSEPVEIVEEQGEWVKIKTKVDGYTGWTERKNIYERKTPLLTEIHAKVNRLRAHIYDIKDTEMGPVMELPFESIVEIKNDFNQPEGRWLEISLVDGTTAFIQRSALSFSNQPMFMEEMVEFSKTKFADKDIPYVWGGRSSFGYDCSGFVQMLYRQIGIDLPRDTKDQIKWEGFAETSYEFLKPGDLVFFGHSAEKINHVGMYLGDDKFIHATVREEAYIHISELSDFDWKGSSETNPKEGWPNSCAYRAFRTLKQ